MLDTDYGNEYANILEVLLWPSVSDEISAVHRDHVKIQSALLSCGTCHICFHFKFLKRNKILIY